MFGSQSIGDVQCICPSIGFSIIGIFVAAYASALGYLPCLRPFRFATHGPLGNLLPLYLSDESACGKNEPANGCVLKLFSDELELSTRLPTSSNRTPIRFWVLESRSTA